MGENSRRSYPAQSSRASLHPSQGSRLVEENYNVKTAVPLIPIALSVMVSTFPVHAETIADRFTKTMNDNGFIVERTAKYVSLDPLDLLRKEPFVRLEARKRLSRDPDLWHVAVYNSTPEKGVVVSQSYYWFSCDLRRMRAVNSFAYEDQRKETSGFDPLGNSLPQTFNPAFSSGELASLGASLPIIDLDTRTKNHLRE
jgi:hypothetical protein